MTDLVHCTQCGEPVYDDGPSRAHHTANCEGPRVEPTPCRPYGVLACPWPERHNGHPSYCPRCGQLLDKVERGPACEGEKGHGLPFYHLPVHLAPCGLPCHVDLGRTYWTGPSSPPRSHSGPDTCPVCSKGSSALA